MILAIFQSFGNHMPYIFATLFYVDFKASLLIYFLGHRKDVRVTCNFQK